MAKKKEETAVEVTCPECGGTGEKDCGEGEEPSHSSHGSGLAAFEEPENPKGIEPIRCAHCNDTGKLEGSDADFGRCLNCTAWKAIRESEDAAEIDPASPEGIALHDQETARLVWDKSQEVQKYQEAFDAANEATKSRKQRYEASVDELRTLIAERHRGRGVRPQKTLFDGAKDAIAPEPSTVWRDTEIADVVGMTPGLRTAVENHKSIETLGDLSDRLEEEDPIWMTPKQLEEARTIIAEKIAEANRPTNALDDLYLEYPLTFTRWERFGLTAKDVEKLNGGETKSFGACPISAFGDIQRFVTPNPANPSFTRTLKDFKGFGDAGYDRYQEAETKFWAWWGQGGKEEFAREKGLIHAAPESAGGEGDREPAEGPNVSADPPKRASRKGREAKQVA